MWRFVVASLLGAVVLATISGTAAEFSVAAMKGMRTLTGMVQLRGPLAATVDLKPETLQLQSEGEPVTGHIELPPPWRVQDIVVSTVRLNGESVAALTQPATVGDYDGDGIPDLMVKFPRAQVVAMLQGQAGTTVTLAVTGMVAGYIFQGADTLHVISCPKDRKNGGGGCDPVPNQIPVSSATVAPATGSGGG